MEYKFSFNFENMRLKEPWMLNYGVYIGLHLRHAGGVTDPFISFNHCI